MYKRLDKCLCCNNPDLREILDLGTQPLANSFHDLSEELPEFELKLMLCNFCWHHQLSIAVDPELLFKNYLYVSGTSQTLKKYCDWFAEKYTYQLAEKGMNLERSVGHLRMLDIACNDGTQLDSFKERQWQTWGVDPAENLYEGVIHKGHIAINKFWNVEDAKTFPKFKLIIAQNVFAHTSDLGEFLEACKLVMYDESVLVIQTSQANMFQNFEFDTIYHEHINFFSVTSMYKVARKHGLSLNFVYKTDIHGTSFVFELGLKEKVDGSVTESIQWEKEKYSVPYFENYARVAQNCLDDLAQFVKVMQNNMGKKVIGYGAAAKGMTVLNAGKIKLDYIIDDNPMKQNLYCPGSNTPIYGSEKLLEEEDNLLIIPLAWNFFEEISEKVRRFRPSKKDKFIQYFPKLKVT